MILLAVCCFRCCCFLLCDRISVFLDVEAFFFLVFSVHVGLLANHTKNQEKFKAVSWVATLHFLIFRHLCLARKLLIHFHFCPFTFKKLDKIMKQEQLCQFLIYLIWCLLAVLRQMVVTRLWRVLIFCIIRESAVDVTLQDVVGHVKVSGRVLKLFPWQARDNVRR